MKDSFKEQFNSLRNVISSNVEPIKGLIAQFDELSNIIDDLSETSGQNDETKKSLTILNSQIAESINQFLEKTKKLFEAYDKLLDEAFKEMALK